MTLGRLVQETVHSRYLAALSITITFTRTIFRFVGTRSNFPVWRFSLFYTSADRELSVSLGCDLKLNPTNKRVRKLKHVWLFCFLFSYWINCAPRTCLWRKLSIIVDLDLKLKLCCKASAKITWYLRVEDHRNYKFWGTCINHARVNNIIGKQLGIAWELWLFVQKWTKKKL